MQTGLLMLGQTGMPIVLAVCAGGRGGAGKWVAQAQAEARAHA